ncbi:MAG: 30S ribosome-binding factor RbfA [Sarcina sp.]
MANYRGGRINEEVKKEVSNIIRNDVKDPRITAMVSVTEVKVTKDLSFANVYLSVFGTSKEQEQETFDIIKKSAGFIRKELGKRVKLRVTPQVVIERDSSIAQGMYIDSLLAKIKEK